ncbi:hypothetical protein FE257_007526 [Aspergillus nanangensis]|uniref:6-methylsalicylate decarboxylase n=1 Tax=Aspergillus nanangensis TaxID=2582783 RepID=A0AAD4GV88_ASPNN|nr:hypothetical protein FE257_007526 [Aspergillus nanangensis]
MGIARLVSFTLWIALLGKPVKGGKSIERIDVHSHFVPPFWREASVSAGYGKPDGMPAIPEWSLETHLDFMKQANITKSIISITSPGTYLIQGNTLAARRLTRKTNEFAADIKRKHPKEFGFWASLPLPDVQGSLVELAYALDHLKADGVTVMTNAHGVYLGDESLDPLFRELNRRNVTVFIHPTSPCVRQGHSERTAAPLTQYPNPMFEFFVDTARAVINLFLSETVARFSGVTYIVPHAGGALPPTIERFTSFASSISGLPLEINSNIVKEAFSNQFYFDLAGFPFPDQIHGLLRYIGVSRLLYGSDFPYTPAGGALGLARTLDANIGEVVPDPNDQSSILTGNAQQLLAK